ncbi:MAG: amidohydrolase [Deltaproteobacteria bacterium]|nr:amidohydrolase [Deltaproteobacteria bacterium]
MLDQSLLHERIAEILPEIITIRHQLHRHPELAHGEQASAALVRETLAPLHLRMLPPFLETDVVALMDGREAGSNVTLRADLDALPVPEKTGLAYASQIEGLSHACGHDGHVAMLLGAAMVLDGLRENFHGSVRFVFQPGEEVVAGGRDLVAKGCLDDPSPKAVFALHGWPGVDTGIIASRPGEFMAAADFFEIRVQGKGAHASLPELSVDPILIAARIVEALQAIPSHRISALEPVVMSVCRFHSGYEANVIPDSAVLEGTVRYLNMDTGREVPEHMETVVRGLCDAMGASYDFNYTHRYHPTRNDPRMVAVAKDVVISAFGSDGWKDMAKPSMGSEDFSYYLLKAPGAMFRLGMGKNRPPLHSSFFDFNDEAIPRGIYFLVAMALRVLEEAK